MTGADRRITGKARIGTGGSAEVTTLANGLRVVSHTMPHLETVALGVWVAAGARHERARENGISHLLEHMAFKGTRRRTARQIAEEIEQIGGELNAATSLEMTAYYARILKGDEGVALDILADILTASSYAEEELAREREVILQEIAGINDSAEELAFDLVQAAAYPDQAVGRPVIGTPASVRAIGPRELRAFLAERYHAPRIVVAAAGAIGHDRLVRHAEAQFGRLNGTRLEESPPARWAGGARSSGRPFEQSHLVLAFEGPSYHDRDYLTAQVFSGLLGGGMSSRLFQEVRESRGLCYAIYSSAWGLADTGMLTIHAATGADLMDQLIDVVAAELARAAASEPAADEVQRAKAQLKAGLLMSLESCSARAEQMARQLLLFDRLIPTEELVARVDAVDGAGLRVMAERLFGGAAPAIAVVGAGRRSRTLAERAFKRIARTPRPGGRAAMAH
jgi:predicted Zn-dependent peptidase